MSISWNVRDTQVFDELANGLRETTWMIQDIDSEANAVLTRTIQNCEQAISRLQSKSTSIEVEIEQLKRKRSQMQRKNAPTASVDAEIRTKERQLQACNQDLSQVKSAEDRLTDSKRAYDAAFSEQSQSYKDNVNKACKLLNHFGLLLTQSRMGS